MKYPRVLVIILNYCGRSKLGGLLDACISSVLNTDYPNFAVLFVDNNSNDGSVEYVKKHYEGADRLSLLVLDHNYGYAGGNNLAVQFSSVNAKFVAFLNPDVVVSPNWLAPLVEIMESDLTIGVVQPKILLLNQPERINSVGMWLTCLGMTEGPEGSGSGFMELDRAQYDNLMEIFSVAGAGFIMRKTLFERIRGFDFDYFMFGEELDLCWKVWLCGFRVLYVPFSNIFHLEGGIAGSVNKPTPLRMYYGERNRLLNLLKNYELHNIAKYFVISVLFIALRKGIFSIKNKTVLPLHLYFKALTNIVLTFPQTNCKRLLVNRLIRQVSDEELFARGLIRTQRRRKR